MNAGWRVKGKELKIKDERWRMKKKRRIERSLISKLHAKVGQWINVKGLKIKDEGLRIKDER